MRRISTIEILGGGPAGLYTAILVRWLMPHVKVRVTEQNPRGATFGFGVVFSDRALEFLEADDPETHGLVAPAMERWRDMILHHPQGAVTLDGVGFSAIGRLELIEILGARAEALGATTRFAHPIRHIEELDGDLIVGADGLNSLVRRSDEDAFAPHVEHFANYFAWFGTPRRFETLTQTFVRTDEGAFNAHHYRYAPEMSTFIIECTAETFERCGLADKDEAQSARACEEIFAEVLDGAPLVTNQSQWRRFPRLWCKRWISGNRVILGDAAHTAHFSIGSGTRLALEDALALVASLAQTDDLQEALAAFESSRQPVAQKIVAAANSSAQWYETFSERMRLPPLDFAFDYVTRSGRIDLDRLRTLAPRFMARYEAERATGADTVTDPVAPDAPGSIEIGFDRTRHRNCSAVLWDNLDRNPDKLAVTGPAGDLTYRELCARAAKWGNAFKTAGLARRSRIAFFLDDTPAYPAAFFGAVRAGFVPVLLNIQSRSDLLNYFLEDSNATLAVCEASLASSFDAETLEGTSVERVVMVNGTGAPSSMVPESAFVDGESDELACADTGSGDMAFWMYSSGSTGRPKGIVHLHHDMAYTHQSFGSHVLRLREDDRCFSVPKIFFAYGFGNSLTFPFSVGATTVLMSGRPEAGGGAGRDRTLPSDGLLRTADVVHRALPCRGHSRLRSRLAAPVDVGGGGAFGGDVLELESPRGAWPCRGVGIDRDAAHLPVESTGRSPTRCRRRPCAGLRGEARDARGRSRSIRRGRGDARAGRQLRAVLLAQAGEVARNDARRLDRHLRSIRRAGRLLLLPGSNGRAGEDLGPVGLAARSGALPQRASGGARVCRPRARAAGPAHDAACGRASG